MKKWQDKEEFKKLFTEKAHILWEKDLRDMTLNEVYQTIAYMIRDLVSEDWIRTNEIYAEQKVKQVYYFSIEFLIGRLLESNLLGIDMDDVCREGLADMGWDLDKVIPAERDPGLGNGGLGRLAACFIDSLAALQLPGHGNSIRYQYGLFNQRIVDNQQVELPDNWLVNGYPWEVKKVDKAVYVRFGGNAYMRPDEDGNLECVHEKYSSVRAVPYDVPIIGYHNNTVNTLRLWSAKSYDEFDLLTFNKSEYLDAVKPQVKAENISKILYPEDSTPQGKALRLEQQYFFVAASLHDAIRVFYPGQSKPDLTTFPSKITFQLNDTHPVIGIPELMRILIDEYGYDWDTAWSITTKTFNYTCHTLLPEALEVWPAKLISELLPRHMEIINEINEHFLAELKTKTRDKAKIERMRIVTDEENPKVRMAYLATAGGSHVNGVAELHSELLKDVTLRDFSDLYGDKFTNVTNGVTPRRFIRLANPRLSALITEGLGTDKWLSDLELLKGLEPLAKDDEFVKKFAAVKQANKEDFTAYAKREYGFDLDPNTMFNTMVKRLHEYKRQSLKILALIAKYADIKSGRVSADDVLPRTVIFGAKSAPGYYLAKMTIQLINNVARVVNNDPDVKGKLHVFFPWNYNVRLAQHLIPATDLDEQISQAGKEASGTGNMKFALNGALTVGTLDGANVEIRERVGAENFFLFGMTVDEVDKLYEDGYSPAKYYEADPRLKAAIDMVSDGTFSNGDRNTYAPLVADWLTKDWFMTLADFTAYSSIQSEIEALYRDPLEWNRKAVLNVANSGYFSSDRSIQDYLDNIWHTSPLA